MKTKKEKFNIEFTGDIKYLNSHYIYGIDFWYNAGKYYVTPNFPNHN